MKMNFVKMVFALILTTGLTATAAETKKTDKVVRKAASKLMCADLNKPIEDIDQYSLEEADALRNSVFAQYGYKFNSAKVTAEMKQRGCLKEGLTYKYENLTQVDKDNIKALKNYEASLKSALPEDFAKSWSKTATKPKDRQLLLENAYCLVAGNDGEYLGLLNFGSQPVKDQKFQLAGVLDLKAAKYRNEDGDEAKLDSTSLRSLDSTSAMSVELQSHGTWFVDKSGNVIVSIAKLSKADSSVKLEVRPGDFAQTNILSCKVAKK